MKGFGGAFCPHGSHSAFSVSFDGAGGDTDSLGGFFAGFAFAEAVKDLYETFGEGGAWLLGFHGFLPEARRKAHAPFSCLNVGKT
jgi:hypothetical protein